MRVLIPKLVLFFICHLSFGQTYNFYYGNLHSHTGFSDGSKDSATSGVSNPSQSYSYAKHSEDFDFLGISEHNHYTNKTIGFKLPRYKEGLAMADASNEDGKFLSLFGMEFGVSSGNKGHVIIYGFDQLLGWETNVPGIPGNNFDIYNSNGDYTGLFNKVNRKKNSFCYLAHPDWTDFTIDGTDSTALAFAPYNASWDSAIVGIPLRSGMAFSVFSDYSDYSPDNYFVYYKKLLHSGYHIGIGYDHDNHYTNFGRSNGGRLVIVAPSLTRTNLYSAMQQMNFYGSDDANAKINFTLNGKIMGSILNGSVVPVLNLQHTDGDGEQADTMRLWRGYKNSKGLWAEIVQSRVGFNSITYSDDEIKPDTEYFYFADIRQVDGQWIVTSPIWYTLTSPLGITKNEAVLKLSLYPNPVSDQLNLSFDKCGDYKVAITDLTGRMIKQFSFFDTDHKVDLSDLDRGLYNLNVQGSNSQVSKMLVVQ